LSNDKKKAARERAVFLRFVERCHLSIDPRTVESRSAATNEPDIRCIDSTTGKPRAFELVQLTDERMMKNLGRQSWHGGWVGDPTEATYRKKAAKTYQTDCPVELLVYGDPECFDDVVAPKLEEIIGRIGFGPFHRVWLMGEDGCYLVGERLPG
jgi:hypothetical protein